MLVELGQHGAELEHEATVVASQVDRAFEKLARRPILLQTEALEPVFKRELLLLRLRGFRSFAFAAAALGEVVFLVGLHRVRLASLVVHVTSFASLRIAFLKLRSAGLRRRGHARGKKVGTFGELSLRLSILRDIGSDRFWFRFVRIHGHCAQLRLRNFLALTHIGEP